jgi:catechol 2,3-dioxygenase-like lactoylglutathione lyase family enzyme
MPDDTFPEAAEYGRGLGPGLGLNLIVADVARAVRFQTTVLEAQLHFQNADFAVLSFAGSQWMVHSDRSYRNHEMRGILEATESRGGGAELRLHGRDPDAAEAAARDAGYIVLAGALDKPHGRREAYIADDDGYIWVPDVPLPAEDA